MKSFVDRAGTNYSLAQVVMILGDAIGATENVLDHIKIGGIYENGYLWFQRLS